MIIMSQFTQLSGCEQTGKKHHLIDSFLMMVFAVENVKKHTMKSKDYRLAWWSTVAAIVTVLGIILTH